ncbi:hypothetical protein DPMN_152293 [Dreissena polymorpha]|uniref:TLDc domain-containing protein n=1 Tax=Dreissena polymorpha TaxID=45954 RepID=A0A9D4FIN2_DREPO|nr:hypothetical protein DPMN_152293 [Dreissena polymorpha]
MFTLLYSAKKDGCSVEKFHEKCDYQGATLTVVYNRCNSVFGGYATTSWAGEINGYIRDDKAFLFQLKYSGKETFRKFHNTSTTEGIFSNSFYGPVFGGKCGHDMSLFSGTIHASKGNFLLNGAFDVNRTYSFSGVSSWQQVHNGDLHATDIEVYSVASKL